MNEERFFTIIDLQHGGRTWELTGQAGPHGES